MTFREMFKVTPAQREKQLSNAKHLKQWTSTMAADLSRQMNAQFERREPSDRVSGIYQRSVNTPTGRLAVIRREDTFTLAPWKPAIEAKIGRAVTGHITPSRVTWTLDRGRTLPGPWHAAP